MKKLFLLSILSCLILFPFNSCKDDVNEDLTYSILPSRFGIDIPDALSYNNQGSQLKVTPLSGNKIYEMMRLFINVGEESTKILTKLFTVINALGLDKPMEFTFVSDEDHRTKSLSVVENVLYNDVTWNYMLTISDGTNPALQVFWNQSPIVGIAIMQPFFINSTDSSNPNAKIKIEYSEFATEYSQRMVISIAGLSLEGDGIMNNLKMFVGKSGDLVDIYGNANLPGIALIDTTHQNGYSWSFVGRSNTHYDIGVAQVGLPPSNYSSIHHIFDTYSIQNVFSQEINIQYPNLPQEIIDEYLANTTPPAYFQRTQGFIGCGPDISGLPAGFDQAFVDLSGLNPYVPGEINSLVINFYQP